MINITRQIKKCFGKLLYIIIFNYYYYKIKKISKDYELWS